MYAFYFVLRRTPHSSLKAQAYNLQVGIVLFLARTQFVARDMCPIASAQADRLRTYGSSQKLRGNECCEVNWCASKLHEIDCFEFNWYDPKKMQ